ncbi:hypothetical protein JMJ77_0006284 [Colletotrichum scovillei]|uniref:Uncharacterized protein n=1 Tax=Colletotrichum scovillei TaxID=1209932 RepID=A0A9P7UJ19_9PEZI|nr:hypothetical protein JMJ77_0006284 [Colletotrichum scovillei]KAG7077522.1 hypothetical protein JMJ76_0014768 [Colletotrichum scovillei]KAG7084587.1 hypothetical protein JMJ78_0010020 [Colletotrichum scovillei]
MSIGMSLGMQRRALRFKDSIWVCLCRNR